jgi:hypothetical protein
MKDRDCAMGQLLQFFRSLEPDLKSFEILPLHIFLWKPRLNGFNFVLKHLKRAPNTFGNKMKYVSDVSFFIVVKIILF